MHSRNNKQTCEITSAANMLVDFHLAEFGSGGSLGGGDSGLGVW